MDVVIFALGLIDTNYRFGGKNPEAGFDCSGMVSYIYRQAADVKVAGSAADIARHGRPVDRDELRPGDLVFFNTRNAPYSHVGIYIGDDRFVHAPSTRGQVRIDKLAASYYAQRFQTARNVLRLNATEAPLKCPAASRCVARRGPRPPAPGRPRAPQARRSVQRKAKLPSS
jgi:hypothetical protein